MSRCPAVVSTPTRAPLRSTRAFVATVVPCTRRSVSARSPGRSRPTSPARRPSPSMIPRDGSSGVEADLARATRPVSSTETRSVNVPPTSMPIRYTCRSGRASAPEPTGPCGPARPPGAPLRSDEPVSQICGVRMGIAFPRIPVPPAARRFDEEHVARAHRDADLLGAKPPRPRSGDQPVAMRETVLPPQEPVRRMADAVAGRVRDRRLVDLDPHLQHRADPAPKRSRPARPGTELVRPEEQREPGLGHLHAAKLDPPGRLPLAHGRPPV